MPNKITLELILPLPSENNCEAILLEQTELLINTWRNVLSTYKNNFSVPAVYCRQSNKTKTNTENHNSGLKNFSSALIEHHLQFMPKDDVGGQMRAIKTLFATGKSADECIELYNVSRTTYKLTSWRTVLYKLGKMIEETKEISELPASVVESLKNRYSKNDA